MCMLACSYVPYKVQNKNTIFKHVLLKQDVDSSGFSDYTTAHECKHLSMSESLLIVSDSMWSELYYTNVIIAYVPCIICTQVEIHWYRCTLYVRK